MKNVEVIYYRNIDESYAQAIYKKDDLEYRVAESDQFRGENFHYDIEDDKSTLVSIHDEEGNEVDVFTSYDIKSDEDFVRACDDSISEDEELNIDVRYVVEDEELGVTYENEQGSQVVNIYDEERNNFDVYTMYNEVAFDDMQVTAVERREAELEDSIYYVQDIQTGEVQEFSEEELIDYANEIHFDDEDFEVTTIDEAIETVEYSDYHITQDENELEQGSYIQDFVNEKQEMMYIQLDEQTEQDAKDLGIDTEETDFVINYSNGREDERIYKIEGRTLIDSEDLDKLDENLLKDREDIREIIDNSSVVINRNYGGAMFSYDDPELAPKLEEMNKLDEFAPEVEEVLREKEEILTNRDNERVQDIKLNYSDAERIINLDKENYREEIDWEEFSRDSEYEGYFSGEFYKEFKDELDFEEVSKNHEITPNSYYKNKEIFEAYHEELKENERTDEKVIEEIKFRDWMEEDLGSVNRGKKNRESYIENIFYNNIEKDAESIHNHMLEYDSGFQSIHDEKFPLEISAEDVEDNRYYNIEGKGLLYSEHVDDFFSNIEGFENREEVIDNFEDITQQTDVYIERESGETKLDYREDKLNSDEIEFLNELEQDIDIALNKKEENLEEMFEEKMERDVEKKMIKYPFILRQNADFEKFSQDSKYEKPLSAEFYQEFKEDLDFEEVSKNHEITPRAYIKNKESFEAYHEELKENERTDEKVLNYIEKKEQVQQHEKKNEKGLEL
uniref:hypothetical protein n=1 Tax=uncultured Allobacillus sp. TaxID=1638025 RepID=UPI002594AD11|nr:hypothetical protein [uncultured Allobacillus sp.]